MTSSGEASGVTRWPLPTAAGCPPVHCAPVVGLGLSGAVPVSEKGRLSRVHMGSRGRSWIASQVPVTFRTCQKCSVVMKAGSRNYSQIPRASDCGS